LNYENEQKWLKSKYRIPKKASQIATENFDFEFGNRSFDFQPISNKPQKPIFSCHICGKKTESRRALEKHINAHHKIKCAVVGCPKLFWKPTANNEHRYRQAIIRHHHAKHFCSD